VYQHQEIVSLYINVYKCPKGYLSTLYEKDIIFLNCTNMRSKIDAVILKLNNIFKLVDFKFST
jgi:hypothetical protein